MRLCLVNCMLAQLLPRMPRGIILPYFAALLSIYHSINGLCEAKHASFASCSHRWEVCYIQGRYGQVLKHHYMVIPTTSEWTTGGRPSVNTVGTIRCWKWMLNHIKDIYRELAFASCGHRCLEWILWVLHRHCDQDRLCGCNMSLIWFLQMDIYGCADFRQGFWE